MQELAKKIIELRLATRRACMCEGLSGAAKNTLSLKTKVLYLIERGQSTREILASLMIAKTNLALITKELAQAGLITKTKSEEDRRAVNYTLTDEGHEYLSERLFSLGENAKPLASNADEYRKAMKLLDDAIKLLNS